MLNFEALHSGFGLKCWDFSIWNDHSPRIWLDSFSGVLSGGSVKFGGIVWLLVLDYISWRFYRDFI